MNKCVKYIYFEIYKIYGPDLTEPTIRNENSLLFKPNTNSEGIFVFSNLTERKGVSEKSYVKVDQYWIDLEKYKNSRNKRYDFQINTVLKKVIRQANLEKLLN